MHRLAAALVQVESDDDEDHEEESDDNGESSQDDEEESDVRADENPHVVIVERVAVETVDLSSSPEKGKNAHIVERGPLSGTPEKGTPETGATETGNKNLARLASESPGKMNELPASKRRPTKPDGAGIAWKRSRYHRLAIVLSLIQHDPFNAAHGGGGPAWVKIEAEVYAILGFAVSRATLRTWANFLVATYNAEGEMKVALQSGQNDLQDDTEFQKAIGDLADLYDQAAEYKAGNAEQKARKDTVREAGKALCQASLEGLSSRLSKTLQDEEKTTLEDEETDEQEADTSTKKKKKRNSAKKKLNASPPASSASTSSAPLTAPRPGGGALEKYLAIKERDATRANDLAERRLKLEEAKLALDEKRQNAMLDADVATKLADAAQKQAQAQALTASLKAAGI